MQKLKQSHDPNLTSMPKKILRYFDYNCWVHYSPFVLRMMIYCLEKNHLQMSKDLLLNLNPILNLQILKNYCWSSLLSVQQEQGQILPNHPSLPWLVVLRVTVDVIKKKTGMTSPSKTVFDLKWTHSTTDYGNVFMKLEYVRLSVQALKSLKWSLIKCPVVRETFQGSDVNRDQFLSGFYCDNQRKTWEQNRHMRGIFFITCLDLQQMESQ